MALTDTAYEPQVKDLMTAEVFTLHQNDNLTILQEFMKWKRVRHVPVLDDDENLIGLVTHRDFLKAAISRLAEVDPTEVWKAYKEVKIAQIMNTEILTISPHSKLSSAAELMATYKYGCLPVVEEGRLVGILTEADFVKAFYDWDVNFAQ